jgi:type IV secretory pathway TrbD component
MLIEIPPQFCARFRESANRPHLLLGCEPSAIALAFLLCLVIGYSAPTFWGISGAIVLFLLLRRGLRAMAVEDPILIKVYDQSQRYRQGFWTAKPQCPHRWLHR